MEYMVWTDGYSVKVKEIDEQHKKLVGMINTLNSAMSDGLGPLLQKDIINEMAAYALSHFATEEKYMLRYIYPDYAEHKKEHDIFTQKAKDLQERFSGGNYILTVEILSFLRHWLYNHIMKTDKKYSKHFNDHGLK